MKKHFSLYTLEFLTLFTLAVSCGTANRGLGENEYALAKNEIEVINSKSFNTNDLTQYIQQSANKFGSSKVIFDSSAVDKTIENIRTHLEYLGYYNSTVNGSIHPVRFNKKSVKVIYDISLGNRFRIDSIFYSLPQRGEFSRDFMNDVQNISIKKGDFLSQDILENESNRGAEHFRNLGYFGFTKNHYSFEADTLTHPGKLILKMTVNEYTRNSGEGTAEELRKFYIDSVRISHSKNLNFRESILKDLNTIKPGEIYSESNINKTYSRLSSIKTFNSVSIEMTQSGYDRVNCDINLSESKLKGFKANLEASTNSTGLMGLSPQFSFYDKNIFNGGEWLNLSFMGNTQFKFNEKSYSNELGVSAGLSFPRFVGLPYKVFKGSNIPRTEFNVSYNYQNRPEYIRSIISTSMGYSGVVRNTFSYQIYPLQLNIVRLNDIEDSFYESLQKNPFMKNTYMDHFDAGVSGSFIYSGNNPNSYIRFGMDLSGNMMSMFKSGMKKDESGSALILGTPFAQYCRAEITIAQKYILGNRKKHTIATRFFSGAGYAYGNSSALPFEKQFYAGGASSMRGWQARTLGPGQSGMDKSFIIPSQTGDMKLEASIEYRFPLFWKLEGALFMDAGNVWTLQDLNSISSFKWKTLDKSIAADWGTGIRIDLSFLVLRVDWGFKVHDPSRDNQWIKTDEWLKNGNNAIHFGVGYPF